MSVPYLKLGITAPIAGTPYLASDCKVFFDSIGPSRHQDSRAPGQVVLFC